MRLVQTKMIPFPGSYETYRNESMVDVGDDSSPVGPRFLPGCFSGLNGDEVRDDLPPSKPATKH